MAVIKVACSKCGQKVSGDESFYGATVECPICSASIHFPKPEDLPTPVPPKEGAPEPEEEPPHEPAGADRARIETTSIPLPPESRHFEEEAEPEPDGVPGMAIASLIMGGLNLLTGCLPAILLAPLAIIFGHLALGKLKHQTHPSGTGRTMAMIGLILGYIGLATFILAMVGVTIFREDVSKLLGGQSQ